MRHALVWRKRVGFNIRQKSGRRRCGTRTSSKARPSDLRIKLGGAKLRVSSPACRYRKLAVTREAKIPAQPRIWRIRDARAEHPMID
jgi:hypothetical protein